MAKKTTCFDVASYILGKIGTMTTWKLQKLCYYSQVWSVVWDNKPLFSEKIEAWANGPVIPALYEKHRGEFLVSSIEGDPDNLAKYHKETVDVVLEGYGDKSPQWLSELTHQEAPWLNARERAGLTIGERGNSEITLDDIAEYYGSLK